MTNNAPYGSEWTQVTDEDVARMEALSDDELRPFMRVWTHEFN